jgi:hypothetical protein
MSMYETSPAKKNHSLKIPEAEFLDEIQTKVLSVFLLVIHSHLYLQLCLRFLFLQIHATFYSLFFCKGKRRRGKPDRKPYTLPYGLSNTYRNLKSENSQNYCPGNLNVIACS